jgi:hypothetical protein
VEEIAYGLNRDFGEQCLRPVFHALENGDRRIKRANDGRESTFECLLFSRLGRSFLRRR